MLPLGNSGFSCIAGGTTAKLLWVGSSSDGMGNLVSGVMHRRLLQLLAEWRDAFVSSGGIADPLTVFSACADHLLLVEMDGACCRYVHYGKAFADHFGTDLTGQTIDLVPPEILPADRREMLEFEYAVANRTQRPLWRSYTALFDNGRIETWQRLVLPAGGGRLVVGAFPMEGQPMAADQDTETATGLLRLVAERLPVVLDSEGRILDVALSLKAFGDTRQHIAELEVLASRDALTGAANLRHFHHLAGLELEHGCRMGRAFSILALDIDHFKSINDSWGHAAGDEALRAFVATCRTALRELDILGRCGGEEFAVALPNTGEEAARTIAERLRRQVEEMALHPAPGATLRFTVSIGIATQRPGSPTHLSIAELLARADNALYRSKAEGRNRVSTFA